MGETCNSQQPSSIQKIVPTVQKSLLCAMMLTAASVSAQTEIEADALSVNPSYDITHALQDRLAGVEVQNIGNQPGMEWQVIIRGLKSISGTAEPLLVINGVPSTQNLSSIDPSEITSIQVLKDAATTTIYGSRGKDGVILITTKTGEKNLGVKVSYNGYIGTRKVFGRYPLRNAKELLDVRKQILLSAYRGDDYPSDLDERVVEDFSNSFGEFEKADNDIDWQERLFETGHVNNHNVNVASGWETGSFNLNLGYVKDEGILPEEAYKRLNASFNLRQKVGSYIQLGVNTRLSNQKRTINKMDVADYISISPLLERNMEKDAEVRTQDVYDYETKNIELGVSAEVLCPWVEGLKYRFDGNYFTHKTVSPGYSDSDSYYLGDKDPRFHIRHYQHQILFDKTLADKHELSFLGQFLTYKQRERQDLVTRTWIDSGDSYVDYPQTVYDNSCNTLSYQLGYSYDKRYEVSGAVSKKWFTQKVTRDFYGESNTIIDIDDVSTRYSKSAHAQWNMHNEAFLSEVDWLDALSLRYDCGKIYSPLIYTYDTSTWSSSYHYYSYDVYQERYFSSNLGLDFSLWKGRLNGSFDYYKQKNYDQRIPYRTQSSDPFTVQNKGWELALQGTIIDHWNGWTWSVGANLYANRNEVTEVDDGWKIYKGYPVLTPSRVVYEGIWKEDDPDLEKLGGYPGHIKYKQEYEEREDGSIYAVEQLFPVSMEPKLKGGFNTHLAWRNIDLDIVGAFQVGGLVYCNWFEEFSYSPEYRIGDESRPKNCLMLSDYWTPEHQDARYPNQLGYNWTYLDCLGWYDASMCKIRSITLGYNAEGEWLNKCHISKLRLYATVQNPFVFGSDFYKEFKMDPETNQGSYNNYRSMYGSKYSFPVIGVQSTATRNYIVGVNLEF